LTPVALTLLGFGLGALLVVNGRSRDAMTAQERAIAAQKIAAQTARLARELAEKAAKES